MSEIYEIYYENKSGDIVFCGIIDNLADARDEIRSLGQEFPENDYWYETIYADERMNNEV